MGAPVLNGPFVMPMFRSFVPRKMQPWIYLFIAVTFQLSGGVYLGALNQMIGSMSLMREDILMCMYANLAGMAIYFPLLFRMKFRFTNKTLLTSAALGVLLCNLIAPHITFLPLLWLICFIEGMCKIQGTFECMSNIQLWMTPKRDFTVFFPWLHIVILGSIQLSDLITTYLMYHYHWNTICSEEADSEATSPLTRARLLSISTGWALRFGLPYLPKSLSSSTMATGMTGGTVRSSVSCR